MMDQTIEEFGYRIEIILDDSPDDPRIINEYITIMALIHKRYTLGDADHGIDWDTYTSWEQVQQAIERCFEIAAIKPVFVYDHSGITISTRPFASAFDSGQIGFCFVTKEKARATLGSKRVTKSVREWAEATIESEIKEYDYYLRGEVYGYRVYDPDDNEIDSCWGFYGDPEESGLIETARSNYMVL